jgi:hypothetical protein
MATTAVGPRLGLFGPPPVAPHRSLLTAPDVVVEDDFPRWMNGVVQKPYPNPIGVDQWEPCDSNQKDSFNGEDDLTFDPSAIYLRNECSTLMDIEALKEQTAASLEAGTAQAVELILAQGGGGIAPNVNPFLADSGASLLTPTVLSPRVGMAYLEDHLANNYAARGMIHATPGTVDLLSSVLEQDDSGGVWTQAGTPIVPGRGYVGATLGTHVLAASTAYMFATTQVNVRMTEVTVTDLVSSLDRDNNTVAFIAERFVLVTWDAHQVHAAVLVNWTL